VQLNRPFQGVGQVTRNTCIVAPGRSDRSPTGTGTCARMAVLHARKQMKVGDHMVHESIIGSRFKGTIAGDTTIGGRPAILPRIEGRAWITGFHTYCLDAGDPYPEGYVVADSWGVTGRLHQ
jgi:proline racemase